jgi:hypothetical protein
MLTSFRPAADRADTVVARLLECAVYHSHAEFRCVRNPRRAVFVDALGSPLLEANVQDDAVMFEVGAADLMDLRIEFE